VRGNPTGKEKEMADLLTYGLVLVALIALAALIYLIMAVNTTADDRSRHPWLIPPWAKQMMEQMIPSRKKLPYQGVVKRDWLPTGRIDFATN
jgi:hypothetical protein